MGGRDTQSCHLPLDPAGPSDSAGTWMRGVTPGLPALAPRPSWGGLFLLPPPSLAPQWMSRGTGS